MIKYTSASPFFPQEEIDWILKETSLILQGKQKLSMGKSVAEFETQFSNFCGRKIGVATNSCTSALITVLKNLHLTHKDEVILPTQTFFANLSSTVLSNAKPIFCDSDSNFLLSFEDLKQKVTRNTKALVIVHFCGAITPDIFKIQNYCQEHNIFLIEDCAHAHGASILDEKGKLHMAGSFGNVACYSFFSTKIMTTGEGGMIIGDDEEFLLKCRAYANRGLDPQNTTESFIQYGENFRFSEFSAILGISQLRSLPHFIQHRNRIASIYHEELKNQPLHFQKLPDNFVHAYWRFLVFLHNHDRTKVLKQLLEQGIMADAPYSPLLHLQPILNHTPTKCPASEILSKTHISLPIHMHISVDDARLIAQTLKEILRQGNLR